METLHPVYQAWIVENLLLGCDIGQLKATLIGIGASEALAEQEIAAAQTHPYMLIALRYATTLKKREALLKTLDFYQRQNPDYLRLERRPLPPYQQFLREHVYLNRPALFTGAFDHWPARHWTTQSILKKVGRATTVKVQRGRDTDPHYEMNSTDLRSTMPFGEFIDHVENSVSNDIYMTANNMVLEEATFAFMVQDVSDIGDGYIDMSLTKQRLFLWMGPAGTVTPMHHDLTHNLFFQIAGRKRFRLYPAIQVPYMYNEHWVYSPVDPLKPEPEKFPHFAQAAAIDVTLEPGDFLYIPMAWWHHVVAETPSISLSMTNLQDLPNQFVDYPKQDAPRAY